MGLQFEYRRADVADPASLTGLEGVTAILHCAGVNQPRSIGAVDEAGFRRTLAVKVDGLRNVLAAVDPARLKMVAAFGSIIGRIGIAGELDYAIGNEWLARDVEAFGAAHPHCRCLTFEFSVWSGAGMGERVAHLESLMRAGVSPISIEEGVAAFRSLLASDARGSIVVSGRFGPPATVQFDRPGLPLLRYLENARVHYPGVELVCEATLSGANDPYLDDHIFSGTRLLPGVMALEAMAQAAMAVTGSTVPPAFENVRFLRPIIVPQTGELVIRVAAWCFRVAKSRSASAPPTRSSRRIISARSAGLRRVKGSGHRPCPPTKRFRSIRRATCTAGCSSRRGASGGCRRIAVCALPMCGGGGGRAAPGMVQPLPAPDARAGRCGFARHRDPCDSGLHSARPACCREAALPESSCAHIRRLPVT